MRNIDFGGRAVVVTGGASGIGKATALAFAEFGAKVTILDIDEEAGAAVAAANPNIYFVKADVAEAAQLRVAIQRVRENHGHPADILVSNAGIEDNRSGNLLTMPEGTLRKIVEVNLYGAMNAARAFVPEMPDGGKVVFVGSLQAFMACLPGTSYQASKAGLIGVAKALAIELAPRRINVNVICPAGVATEGIGAARAGISGLDDYRRHNLLGRRARPEEIAFPILFLCSEWANYMTGQILQVDGGMSAMGLSRPGPVTIWPDDPDL